MWVSVDNEYYENVWHEVSYKKNPQYTIDLAWTDILINFNGKFDMSRETREMAIVRIPVTED